MSKPSVSKNAYAKRHRDSNPAPISDSDSEFAAGPYEDENDKKKKRSKGGYKKEKKNSKKINNARYGDYEPPTKKRRVEEVDSSGDERPTTKLKAPSKSNRKRKKEGNPLAHYFQEWEWMGEYSEEEDAGDEADNENESDYGIDEEEDEIPHIPQTMTAFISAAKAARINEVSRSPHPLEQETSSSQTDESSHTEDDDDPTGDSGGPSHHLACPHVIGGGSSHTEDDSEPDDVMMETDDTELRPRPTFQRPESSVLKPFRLRGDIKIPAPLNIFLRDYQRDGAQFFYDRYVNNRGGLLGDDMGLGKTVQVIAFLSAIMGKTGYQTDEDRRQQHVSELQDGDDWRDFRKLPLPGATWPTCLIIAPSSVVHNWQRELETWGYFEVGIYTGKLDDRRDVIKEFKMGRLDIVVTSFDIALRDIDTLDTLDWSCVFVDEVHRVKNLSSKLSIALHRLSCKRRFGLTGTAIQNSYDELHAILHWTDPERMGDPSHWKAMISDPLRHGQSNTASDQQKALALITSDILAHKLLPEFFLRRTKVLIKDQLPKKTDNVVFCPMAPIQLMAYKRILELPAVQHLIQKDDPCECGSGKTAKTRRVDRARALSKWIFPNDDVPNQIQVEMKPEYCGKWTVLESLLEDFWQDRRNNKVLIFTKSVQLLKILENYLRSTQYGFLSFSGETPQKERMGLIDQFHKNKDIFIFLISTLAGGTGLNLTGANKVVIFDPHWNPAHDLQAMDRAYRIGQTKNVTVYRLLGAGSLEELIYACQVYKQQQMLIGYDASIQTRYFEGVKNSRSKQGELFGIKNIFKLDEKKLATKKAIEEANQAQIDWAFANFGGYGMGAQDSKDPDNMAGLDKMLFDSSDGKADVGKYPKESTVDKILDSSRVAYTHHNDDVVKQNAIEVEKAKEILKRIRESKKQGVSGSPLSSNPDRRRSSGRSIATQRAGGSSKVTRSKQRSPPTTHNKSNVQWPPIRKHHQRKLNSQEQYDARWSVLIEHGFFNNAAEIREKFIPEFMKMTREQQENYFYEVDQHVIRKEREKKDKGEKNKKEKKAIEEDQLSSD
ncbi:P-loop containing nucleoside triphosphate hydrolase protein [Rhodocollybia butyracea]|uniref:P-loop containing nucleoside triphosphate hydrolase protein n=1 Tax=Rhodocollybia butyracea TaxID=206335 RepID=A0A9P5UCT7_9AGAR|nr:P-loop containing nucleoside triphosphate hydrolase protein [Rhodocollybia butyracea]